MATDYGQLIGSVLTTGGGVFSSTQSVKAAQINANSQAQNNATALELQRLQNEGAKINALNSQSPAATSNTTLYIALGVGGVLVLGLTIFAVTRK